MHLASATSPGVATTTAVSSSDEGVGTVGAPVTYTATVAAVVPGAGTPTGTVSFSDSQGPILGCSAQPLSLGASDTATCTTTHERPAGTDEVTAAYSGDSNYASSSGTIGEDVSEAPTITSGDSTTFTEGTAGDFTVTTTGTPTPTITETGTLPKGVTFNESTDQLSGTPTQEGVYHLSFEATNGVGSNASQSFTLTVDAAPLITSPDNATFTDDAADTFTVTATGTPAPTITKWGTLPEGVSFSGGVFSGTPTQTGTFQVTLTAANGIGADSTQQFTLTVVGLHVTTSSLPEVTPGVPYSAQLEALGGLAPLKWKVTAHSLPAGLKLSSAGLVSGKVGLKKYAPGTSFPVTVTVTDSTKRVHQTATATFTVVVS